MVALYTLRGLVRRARPAESFVRRGKEGGGGDGECVRVWGEYVIE
jgi:hypothetical protein